MTNPITSQTAEEMAAEDERPTLDAAWAEVEAALPKGYAIMLRGSPDWLGGGPVWKASAYISDLRRKAWNVDGATPVIALQKLAARVRSVR